MHCHHLQEGLHLQEGAKLLLAEVAGEDLSSKLAKTWWQDHNGK